MGLLSRLNSYISKTQLWRSVFRHGRPRDRQTRALVVLNNLFLHIHPASIRRSALKPWYTWGMGWITFYLFIFELVTGVLLMFYYRPVAEYAYQDMQGLRSHVAFGLLREMHRWGGHAMVITIWLHMLRVFFTGSYKPPREFNWVTGVLLLVLTLLLSFTGYLLPWDQLSMWAVTVGTNMAGAAPFVGHEGPGSSLLTMGDVPMVHQGSDVRFGLLAGSTVGPAALLRFYVLHCIALPLIAVVFIAVHFWRIRKDGGISGPP